MIFKVELWAFGDLSRLREVDVPVNELTGTVNGDLDLIFKYGQNNFQCQLCRSISVGDVIRLPVGDDTTLWLVMSSGFRQFKDHSEYAKYVRNILIDPRFCHFMNEEKLSDED